MRITDLNGFLIKARERHGDKYSYEESIYVRSNQPIIIKCPKHGPFSQTPNGHLANSGCYWCGREKVNAANQTTQQQFIEKASQVHKGRYDYSNIKFDKVKSKVEIICPEHGSFFQLAQTHLAGGGCIKCAKKDRITVESFIESANKVHGFKYDYSLVSGLTRNSEKVKILCHKHGVFEQTATNHMRGQRCPKCFGNIKLSFDEFLRRASEIHNNSYDYSRVKFVDSKTKVSIVCKTHGEFQQTPRQHLSGSRCIYCTKASRNTALFIQDADLVHDGLYDYSMVNYTGVGAKVSIGCKRHGLFEQVAQTHLAGHGCPQCANDKKYNFRLSSWMSFQNSRTAKLYLILITVPTGESFYKIGITYKNIQQRFYRYELLIDQVYIHESLDARMIYKLESFVHNKMKANKYTPLHKFSGYTECFQFDSSRAAKSMLIDVIQEFKM